MGPWIWPVRPTRGLAQCGAIARGDRWTEPFIDRWWYEFDLRQAAAAYEGKSLPWNLNMRIGRQFVDWRPYNHPQYGPIEVGGFKRDVGRVPRRRFR